MKGKLPLGYCCICANPEIRDFIDTELSLGANGDLVKSKSILRFGIERTPSRGVINRHRIRHFETGQSGITDIHEKQQCRICLFSQELREEIKGLYSSGWGAKAIKNELHSRNIRLCKQTVSRHLKNCEGLTIWPAGRSRRKMSAVAESSTGGITEQAVENDIKFAKLKVAQKEAEDKYKYILNQLQLAQKKLSHLTDLSSASRGNVVIEQSNKAGDKAEACALVMASDWHVGELVDPRTINHLNEYNPDIAASRIRNFFKNTLKLIEKERQDVVLDKLLLWLGGDLMTGYIHDELMESNTMSPVQESVFIRDHVEAGIRFLEKEGGFQTIKVVCNHGNHGRTTLKRRVQTGANNSFEHMIYGNLARIFHDHDTVDFLIADGYFNYIQVFDKLIRAHHGDNIGYGGGIGGVTIPLMKFIQRSNQQQHASLDIIGHYHQLTHHRHFIINGSLIGFNAYAQSIGASPERPQQAFQLIDSKRGFTVSAPILVTE